MLDLETPTVVVTGALVGMLMSVALLSLWHSSPATVKGLREWTLAPAVLGVSALLSASGRNGPDDFVSVVLAGLLLLVGQLLLFWGLLRFLRVAWRPAAKAVGVTAGIMLPVLLWFAWIDPHHGARVFLACLLMLALGLAAAVLLLRKEPRSFAAGFLVAALAVWCLLLLARMVTVWGEAGGGAELPPPYALAFLLALLALSLGTALLASRRVQREFEYLALHDSLTQALTRRAFVAACERELDRCRRHHRDMAMLLLDIDHFKAINDASGRRVGDEVVLDFSARINDVLRRSDQLGRYEGVSFAVLLPETGPQEALAVAERIRSRTAAMHLSLPSYTVSIGATVNLPGEDSIDALLRRVDMALHKAKKGGRNRVVFV